MKIKYIPAMTELSLWVAWNDALSAGEIPLEDPRTGTQFLGLGIKGLIMAINKGKYGWNYAAEHCTTQEEIEAADSPRPSDCMSLWEQAHDWAQNRTIAD